MHATDVIKLTTQSMASSLPSVVIIRSVGRPDRSELSEIFCVRGSTTDAANRGLGFSSNENF
jgi:hypothetical protein